MSDAKTYLGDGVYADVDGYGGVVLTTENGVAATNTIVLEPAVVLALTLWLEVVRARTAPSATRSE